MKQFIRAWAAVFVAAFVAGCAQDDPFSGSRPLLCTAAEIFECGRQQGCNAVSAEEIDAPQYFLLDVAGRLLVTTRASSERLESPIENTRRLGDVLIVQGIEDGRGDRPDGAGWSVALNDDDGTMAASALIDDAAVVLLGACVPAE